MHTDHDYRIGKDHIVCEDYAISGIINDVAYAIVCDGCSASPDVDFGARALALSARETLNNLNCLNETTEYNKFGISTVQRAREVLTKFPLLHPQALDATLLVAYVKDGILTCYLYGDGVFIHRSKNNIRLIHIDFLSGAPAYLSYNLDDERMGRYNKEADLSKHVIDTIDGSFEPKSLKPFDPVIITSPVLDGDVISVCSDGINSFRKPNNDSIEWVNLIDEFTKYKNFNGEFVKRRINAFHRQCVKGGITHYDDISISTILI